MANVKHNIILGLDARQFKSSIDKASASLNRMQAVFATVIAGQGVIAFAKLGAEVNNVTNAFNRLGDAGLLSDLRAATKGMVSDMDLMKATMQANNFKIPLENLGQYLDFAARRAAETGQSIDYLMNSILQGVSRGSIEVWDNMGFSLDRVRAKLNGVSIEAISVGERAKIMSELVSEEIANMGDMGIDRTQQLIVTFENLRDELSRNLLPVINTIFGKFNAGMVQLTYFKDNMKALVGAYNSMSDEGMVALSRAKDYQFPGLQQAIDEYIAATRKGGGVGDEASMSFITSMREILGNDFDMKAHLRLVEAIQKMYYNTAKAVQVAGEEIKKTGVYFNISTEGIDYMSSALHNLNNELTMVDVEAMEEEFLRVGETLEALPPKIDAATQSYMWLGEAFNQMFNTALQSGKGFFEQMGAWIENFIKRMLAAAAAAAALNLIFPAAGGFLNAFSALSGLKGLTRMAHGGVVDKPTPLIAGEAGPEAIIPLHKLGSMGGTLTTRISGRDLLLILEREQTAKGRIYG